jgi:RNA polymerase sigma factor (sigma-70 family)
MEGTAPEVKTTAAEPPDRGQLFDSCIGLAVVMAKSFQERWAWLEFQDVRQVALLGLWKATAWYDPEKADAAPFDWCAKRQIWCDVIGFCFGQWKHQKHARQMRRLYLREDRFDEPADPRRSPLQDWEWEDAIDRLLSELTPEENQAIRLRYLQGCRLDEIAQALGVAYRRVRSLIAHGLKVLRTQQETTF